MSEQAQRQLAEGLIDKVDRLEVERDRFKASLTWISELSPVGLNIGAAIQEAQRSLSETEEGGSNG
jgi:hypothetical protein